MSEFSQVSEKVRMLEARVETLAEIAGLSIQKVTALTEVAWYGRQARKPTLTAINNLLIAMDLPGEWWQYGIRRSVHSCRRANFVRALMRHTPAAAQSRSRTPARCSCPCSG